MRRDVDESEEDDRKQRLDDIKQRVAEAKRKREEQQQQRAEATATKKQRKRSEQDGGGHVAKQDTDEADDNIDLMAELDGMFQLATTATVAQIQISACVAA